MSTMTLQAIKYKNGKLEVLDQIVLPQTTSYITVENVNDGWKVINKMQVRGAPAIAIVGCLSLAVELRSKEFDKKDTLRSEVTEKLQYLVSSRPTAVNMKLAADELIKMAETLSKDDSVSAADLKNRLVGHIEEMLASDIRCNEDMGDHGAAALLSDALGKGHARLNVLTHCNAGALATAGYGTALGVIRSLHKRGKLERAFCTETRPYNQGARLTAYEFVVDKIPATLVTDSSVAALMSTRSISGVVTGADCVTANGDTANKIGTLQIAVVAKRYGVPFYVAAPLTTIDLSKKSGKDIVIEERPAIEMTHIGGMRIAAEGIDCWTPAFDVTPAELIQGIITEKGVFTPAELESKVKTYKQSL